MWTYVFFSKQILMETLTRTSVFTGDLRAARDALDEFVFGFNQACERFTMIDVGTDKGAAEAKLKGMPQGRSTMGQFMLTPFISAHLDLHANSSETFKILFGGEHSTVIAVIDSIYSTVQSWNPQAVTTMGTFRNSSH